MTDTFGLNVNSINDPNNKLNHKVYLNIPNIHMIRPDKLEVQERERERIVEKNT